MYALMRDCETIIEVIFSCYNHLFQPNEAPLFNVVAFNVALFDVTLF